MDPISAGIAWLGANLGTVGAIAQGVGLAGDVVGGITQANRQATAYEQQAAAIKAQTRLEQAAEERKNRFILAKNAARTAAAGVSPSSGSPLEFDLENAFNAGMNEAAIKYGGDLRRWSALTSAGSARAEIPGVIFGGLSRGGSILSNWYYRTKNP